MGCFSGCLMSSAGIQKLFCGIYSVFKCSFDEFVGEKVFSPSYSSTILAPPRMLSFKPVFTSPLSPSSAAAAAKSLQSCPTLCDPIDSSPPGSPISEILQAGTLEWVAISFTLIKRFFFPLHFLPLDWYHLHIWGCWYFSQQSWFQLMIHPAQHFSWCTLHIS